MYGPIYDSTNKYRVILQSNRDWCVGNIGGANIVCSSGAIN